MGEESYSWEWNNLLTVRHFLRVPQDASGVRERQSMRRIALTPGAVNPILPGSKFDDLNVKLWTLCNGD